MGDDISFREAWSLYLENIKKQDIIQPYVELNKDL